MTSKLSNKILEKIKQGEVKPAAKWEFILKEYSIWLGFGLSLILGTIAVSLSLFMLTNNDLGIARHLQRSNLSFWMNNIPFLWMFTFGLFLVLAEFSFKHTKRGYKFTLVQIVIANLVISLFFGVVLHTVGLSKRIDKLALDRVPVYERLTLQKQKDFWNQTEKGFLAGEIKKIIDESSLELVDFKNQTWEVILLGDKRYPPNLEEGKLVKLLGESLDDNKFEAIELRIWNPNLREPGLKQMPPRGQNPRL